MTKPKTQNQVPEGVPAVDVDKPGVDEEGTPYPAPASPAPAESASPNRWQAARERYSLVKFQPYADALARLQPTQEKIAESAGSLSQLREEIEQLRTAVKQAQTETVDARAGLLLGIASEAQAAESQQRARKAQLQLEEALVRLQEAEQVHAVMQRAGARAQEEIRNQAQAAKEFWQPLIREEHEAAVRRVAMAFRELSAALAEERDIRDAVESGPVITLNGHGDTRASIRQFIHTETLPGYMLDWFIELDKFCFGEWLSGVRSRGYQVD